MEGEFSQKLLDLMVAKGRDWMVRDSGGGRSGFGGVQEEKKLELKLGPPGAEDWGSSSSSSSISVVEKRVADKETSVDVLSLGYFPKASNPTKRGFIDTAVSKTEEFQQKQQLENQSHERKAGPPSSSPHAHAPVSAAGINSNSSQLRKARTASVPVVGWPPIRSFRKNLAGGSSKPPPPRVVSQNEGSETGKKPEMGKKGLFVKINMDGVPIGRKVDLKACESYEKLPSAVGELFQGLLAAQNDPAAAGDQVTADQKRAFMGLLDGTGEYTLVYEDNEGDRMLVGDVPWVMFISTARRLRVLKSSELSSIALGSVSRKRAATEC